MLLIHDIVEIDAGDHPIHESIDNNASNKGQSFRRKAWWRYKMKPIDRVSVLLFTCAALLQVGLLAAATEPVRPGAACQTPPLEIWTEPEQWVWKQICEGKNADFNERYDRLDPTISEGWTDSRKLRAVFLEAILLFEPF